MSARVTIRDAIIARITDQQPTYIPDFSRDFAKEASKGETAPIVVSLGDENVVEENVEGVAYRVETEIRISTRHNGNTDTDIQAAAETMIDNIYNALIEWKTIGTDIAVNVPKLHYDRIETSVYADGSQYFEDLYITIEYDK